MGAKMDTELSRRSKQMGVVQRLPLPSWAYKYIEPAFAGAPGAARDLVACSDGYWGVVVLALFRARIDPKEFGDALLHAWTTKHGSITSLPRNVAGELFTYASFDVSHLPERMKVWRGVAGITKSQAVRGYSWTLDLAVARYFATQYASGYPLILSATVSRSDVVVHDDGRREREIVLLSPPEDVVVEFVGTACFADAAMAPETGV